MPEINKQLQNLENTEQSQGNINLPLVRKLCLNLPIIKKENVIRYF